MNVLALFCKQPSPLRNIKWLEDGVGYVMKTRFAQAFQVLHRDLKISGRISKISSGFLSRIRPDLTLSPVRDAPTKDVM